MAQRRNPAQIVFAYQDTQLGTRSGLNPIPAKRRRATGCWAQSRPTPVQDWTDYADLTGRGVGFDSCRIHHAITGGTAVSFKAAIPAGRIRPFGASDPRLCTNPPACHRTLRPGSRSTV